MYYSNNHSGGKYVMKKSHDANFHNVENVEKNSNFPFNYDLKKKPYVSGVL